jgi:membrane-bound lytic murein transglycosylase D
VDTLENAFGVSRATLKQYNYSILKSWPLAITAYNHGVAGMRRAVKRLGTDDIEVILREYDGRTFGFASRNFYVAFLAANEVDQNLEKYFGPVTKDRPRSESVVILQDYLAVDTLENAFGVSRATLKQYNQPGLAVTGVERNKVCSARLRVASARCRAG